MFRTSIELVVNQKLAAGKNVVDALIESIPIFLATRNFQRFLDEPNCRETIKMTYSSVGANSVLHWDAGQAEQLYAAYCAGMVIYLEEYVAFEHKARCIKMKMGLDDIIGGGERATTKFFVKRIPCSCLNERKQRVKRQPKTSGCCACNGIKDCKSLMRCSNCLIVQYCSKTCQRADWPNHRGHCAMLRDCMVNGTKCGDNKWSSSSTKATLLPNTLPTMP